MKYYLFAGDQYYPLGGFEDFKGCFGSIDEARKSFEDEYSCDTDCWAHIVFDDRIICKGYFTSFLEDPPLLLVWKEVDETLP
jgi:hypothetical protein